MKISADIRRVSLFLALTVALAPVALFAATASVPTISFGDPVTSGNIVTIPVYLDAAGATDVSAWSISVRAPKDAIGAINIRRAPDSQMQPQFETSARNAETVTYLAWSSDNVGAGNLHIVDVEVAADHAHNLHLDLDTQLTTLSDKGGTHSRSVANGQLKIAQGVDLDKAPSRRRTASH